MNRSKRHLPLYLSAPHPCSYLPDRQSNTLFADPAQPMDMRTYGELLHYGFRRSGRVVYAPRCEDCSQCVSVRIPVDGFALRRKHRRILRSNHDIALYEHAAKFNRAHYDLYQAYTRARHQDGDMANASPAEYLGFLRADWCDTSFLEFSRDGELVAVAVTDVLLDGLSAVYTFFDPDLAQRSLGTFAILSQIDLARRRGLSYLYLGYWVRDSRKMAYKTEFRPIELCYGGRWRRVGLDDPLPD